MGIVFSHTVAAGLYYFRNGRSSVLDQPLERNGQQQSLLTPNQNKPDLSDICGDTHVQRSGCLLNDETPISIITEALMPVLDATNLTELREAIKLTISRCVLNTQLIKVFLRDPLTSHLVDEHCRPLPNSRFISDILHQKGKTVVSVNHNQDSIRELLGSQHSNDNNHSGARSDLPVEMLLLPIPERGTHRSIGLIVVVSQAGSLSSVDPKRVELCLKQISVTYEVVKNNLTKENAPPHISNLLSLIQLCGELNDPDAAKLEIKVVRYLQRHTDAESGFLLLVVPETQMLFCQAVGDTVLQEEVRFAGPSSCFAKALETKQPITLADIPVERRHEVEKIIRRQINTLLCVPVCVSDSKDLLALACMVNKSNNEQFTQQDIDTILQCFKYTATVLTSTLAFQNERKLKNQTQALLLVARKLFTRLDANLSQSWDETANLNKVSSVEPDSGHSAGLSGSPRLIRCQGLGPTSSHCSEPGCIAQLINSLPTNQAQNTLIVLPLSAFRGSDQSSTVCRPESCLVERAHSTVRHRRSDSESSSEYSTASSSAPSSNQPLHNNNPNKKPSLDMKNDKSTDPTICGEHNVFDHRSITDSSTCFYFKQIDDLARDVGLRLRDQHEDMTLKELEFNRYFFNNLEQFQELLSAVNSDNINYASPESCISPVLNTSPLANLSSMTSMSADIMKDYFQCEDNVHLPDKQIHIDNYTQCESCKLKPDIRSRTFRKFKSPDQTFFGQKQSVKSALQSKRSNSISLQRSNIKMLSHTSLPPEKGSHCSTRIKNTLSKQCRSLSNNRNMVNRSSPKVDAGYCKKNRKPLCRLCRSVSNSRSRGVSLSPLERKKTSTVVEVSTDSVYQVVKPSAQCGIEDVSDEASFHSLSDEDTDLDNTDTSIQRLLTSIQDSSRNDLQCSLVLKVKKCSTEEKSDLFQLDSDLGLQNTNDKSVAEVQVGQKDKDSLCTLGVGKSCHSNKQGFALLAENFTTDELVTYPDPCRTTQSSPLNQQASVAQLTGEGDDELVTYHDPCTHSSPLTEQASVAQLTGEGDHLTSAVDRHIELCSFNLAFGDSFEPVGCLGKDPVLPVNTKLDSREQILKVEDIVVVQNEETQFIQGSNNNDNNCDYFQDAFDCFQETKMDYSHCMKYIETDHFQSDLIACEHVESAHVVSVVRKTDEVSIKIHFENDLRHRALRFHNNEFISDGELDYKDQLKNDEDANCVTGINAENFTCASRVLKSETNVKTHHLAYHLEQGVDSFAPRDVIPSAIDLKHVSSDSEPQFVEELSILWEGSLLSQQDEESMSVTADVKDLESLNGSEESNLNLDLDMCSVYLEETNYEDVASSHVIRVPGDLQQTEPIVTSSIKTDTWEINSLIREYKKRFLEDNISLPFVKTQCCAELAFKKSDATTEIEYDPSLKTETEENKDLSLRSHFLNINTDNVSTCKQTDIRAEKPIKSGVIWSQEINTEVEHCLVPDNIQMFSMNSDLTLHQDLSVEQTTGFIFDQECPNLAANVVNLDSLDNIAVDDDFIFYPDMFSYEIHLKDDSDSLSSDMSLKEDSRNVHISVSSQDYSQQEESDQQVNEESNQEVYEESNQEVYEESDQQVNEDSNQEVYEESDQQVNEESNQEVYEESDQVNEESDQEVNEESYQEVNEESYQEVNEESYQEVNEESYQEVNEESDQQVNEEFFDQQVNEESDQEVNEESDQEVNEESDQEVNEESDQEVNEESDQEVNEESDQQINEESDQEVNEEFLDQQVNEEFDQEVKEKSDQEINEEFDQQVNEKFDQQVNEESDQQINEESDQEVNEEFLDQQVNEEFDQEVNEESYQEVNEESYQEVNEESYQEVNEESDQQVNEESDQEVNEEFLDQQVNEEFDQEVKEKSDQEINEESDQEVNEESDQEVNEESDQEVNEESDQQVNEEFFDQEVNEEFFDQEVNEEFDQQVNEESNQEVYEESDQQVNEESNQEVYEESDQQVNEESNQEVYEESDQQVNEESNQEVYEESDQQVNEESNQEVNEESYQEVNEESDQQVNEEFFDQQVNEESVQEVNEEADQEVNEESYQEVNEESDQEVNEKSDQEINEEFDQQVNEKFDQQVNEESDQEVNEEFLDQQVNEEFDQEVKEKSDQEINEESDQEVNEESDQEVNEESDQQVNEEFFDQEVNEEFDQQVNEEFDQQVNEKFDQQVNEESDQEVNEESDQQVNEETDPQDNEESDHQDNEESDQEVNEESDQQVNEETDPQDNEESDHQDNEESDQQDNEESDQEVNDNIEFNKESDQVNDEIEINKVFDHECYDFSDEFKKINDESDQDVNDEMDFKDQLCQFNDEIDFNEDFGQQVNDEIEFSEESDQKVNEEFDQEVTYETDFNKEFDQQLVNERDFKPHHHEKDLNIESNQEVETKLDVQQECSLQIIFTTDFSQKLNLEINGEICSLKKSNQQNVVAINAMRITEQIKLNEESSQILDDINFNADAIEIQKDIDLNAESSQIQKDIDFKADSSVVLDEIDYIEEACYLVPVKNHLTRELNLQSQENKDLVRKFYQVLDKTSYINESNQKIPEEKDATEKYFHQESIHQSHENKYFNEESSHENHEDKDMHEEAIQCNLDEAYFKEESSQQSHNVKDFDDESTHYIQDVKLSQQIHDEIYFKIQYIHDEIGFNEEASQQSHDDFNEKAAEQSHYDFNEEPAQPIYDDDLSLQIQEKKDICMKSSEQIYYKEDYIADSGQQSHDETDLKEELHPKNQNKINLFQKLNPQIINKIASCDTLNFPMNDEIDFTYESTQHKSYESGITQKYVESLSEDQQIITALDSNEESREPMCPDLDWNKQCTPSSDTLTLIQETIEQVITEGNVHSQTIPSLPNKTNALFIQDTQGIIKELGLIKLRQPMAEKTTEGEEHHIITAINLKNDKLNEEHNKCNETNDITADNQQIILYKIESKKMNEQVLEEDICTEISDQDILKVSCNETSSHYTEVFIEAFSQLIHDEIVEVSSQQSDHDVSKQQSDNEIDLEDVIVSSLGQINGPLINILHLEALSDVCEYDNDVVGLDSTQCLPTDLEIKYDEGSISFLLETADELEKTELLSYPTRVQDTTFHYEMGGQMYEIEEEKLYQLAQEILGESPEQEEILLEKMADLNYCCLDYASQEPVVRRQDVYLTKDLFLADSSKEVIFHTDSVIETKCGSSFDHANIHLKWADRSNRESDLHCEAHLLPEHYVKLAHCATSYHLPDTDKENFEPFETSTDLSIDEVTGLKHVSLGTVADALSPKRPLTISYSDHDIAIGFFNSQSFPLLDDQSMSLPDISICSHFDWSQNSNRPMTRFSDATDMRSWSSVPSVHKKMSPFDSQLRKTKSDQNLKLLSPRYSWSPSTQNSFYVHPKPWDEHQQANDLSPLCLSSSGTLNTSSSSLGQNISATAQRILKEDEEIRSDPSTKRNIAAGYSRHLKDSFTYGEFSRDLSHLKNKYQSGFKSMPRNDMEDLSLKTESNTKRVVKAIRNNLHSSYARSSDILKTLYEPETTSFKDPNSQPDFKSNWKSSGDNEREAFRYHYKKITDDFSELDHVYTCNNLEHGQGFNEHSGQLVGCSSQSCLVGQESEHMSTSRKRYINDYSYRTWNESDLNLTADDTDFLGDFKKPLPFDHTKYYKNKIHGSNTYMTFSCPKDETYGRLIFHQHNHGDESQIPSHSHFQSSFMDYLNADSRQHRVSFLNEKTNFDLSTESGLDSSMTDSLFDGILDKGSDDSFECHFLSSKFAGARRKENNNHYDESILESSLAEEVSSRDDMEDTFNECMLMNNKEMEDHGFVTPAFTNRGINAILAEDTSEGSDSGESDPMENNVYPNTDAPNVCLRKTLANQTGQKDVKESDVKRGYVDRENQDPLTLGHLDCNLAGGPLNLNINVVLQVSKSQNTSENLNYAKLVAFNSVSTQFSLQNSIGNSEDLDNINIQGLQSALQDYQSRSSMLSPVLEVLDDDPATRTDELISDCSPGEDTQVSEHAHENCVLKEDKIEDPPDILKYKPQNESSEENSEDFITLETDKITKVVYKSKTKELKKEGLGDGVAHMSVRPKSQQLSDAKEDVCVSAGDNAAVNRLVEALKQLHSCALQSIPPDGSKPDHQFVSLMNKEMLQMFTLHDTPVNSPPTGRSYLNDDKPHNESCSSEDTLSLRRNLAEDQQEKYVHTCASQSLPNKSEFQGDQNQIPEIINSDKRTTLVTGVLKPLNCSYNLVNNSTHDTFISQTPLSPKGYRDTIINRSVSTDVMGNGSLANNLFTNSSKSLDILSEGMRREGTSIFSKIRRDYSRDTQQQNAFTKGNLTQDALRSDKHLTSDSRAQDAPVDNFDVIDKSLKPRISCPQLISKDSQKSLYCHFSDGNAQKLKQLDELVISRPQNLLTSVSQNREDNFTILNSVWPKLNKTQSLQSNNYELNSFNMDSPDMSTKLCYQRDLGSRCRSHGVLPRISEAYEILNSNSLTKKDFIMEHQVSDIDTSRTCGAFPQEMSLCNTHTPYNAPQQVHNSIIGSKDACSGQKDELSISTQELQAKTFNLQSFGLVNAITSKHACTSANISDITREIHTQSDVDTILNAVTKEKTTSNEDVFVKVKEETSHEKAGKESTGQLGCNGDNNQIKREVTIQERHVFEKLKVTSTSKTDIKNVRDLEDDKEAKLTKQIWKAADVSGDVGNRVFFDQSKRENMWASRDQSNALINGHGAYKIGDSNGDGCIKSDDCHAIKSVVPLTDIDHMKSDSHGRPAYTETSSLPIADLVPADETVTMENKAVGSSVQTQEKCVETDNPITNEQWSNAEMDPLFKSPYLESTTLNIKQNDLLKLLGKTDVCLKEIKLVLLNKDMVQAQVDSNGKTDQSSLGMKHLTQKLSSLPIIVTKDDVNLNEEDIELQKNRFKSPISNSSYFSVQHNKCLEPVQDQHTKELEADEQSFKSVCEMIRSKRESSNDMKQIQDPHHSPALEDQQISTPLMDRLASPLLVDFLSCSSESCDSEWQSTFSQSGNFKFYDTFPKVIPFDHSESISESSLPDITDFDESNLSSDEDTRDADVSSLDTTLIAPSYSEKYRLSQPIKYQSLFRKRHGSNQTKSDLLFHKDNPEASLLAPNQNLVQDEIIGILKDNVDSCAADVESLSDFAKVAAPIKSFRTIPFSVAPVTDRFPSFFKTQSCQEDKKNTTEKQSVFKQRGCQQERYNSFILADKSGKHKARASDLAGQLYSPRVSPKKHLITEGEATPGSVLLDSFYSKPVQANHWLAFKSPPSFRPSPTNKFKTKAKVHEDLKFHRRKKLFSPLESVAEEKRLFSLPRFYKEINNANSNDLIFDWHQELAHNDQIEDVARFDRTVQVQDSCETCESNSLEDIRVEFNQSKRSVSFQLPSEYSVCIIDTNYTSDSQVTIVDQDLDLKPNVTPVEIDYEPFLFRYRKPGLPVITEEVEDAERDLNSVSDSSPDISMTSTSSSEAFTEGAQKEETCTRTCKEICTTKCSQEEETRDQHRRQARYFPELPFFNSMSSEEEATVDSKAEVVDLVARNSDRKLPDVSFFAKQTCSNDDFIESNCLNSDHVLCQTNVSDTEIHLDINVEFTSDSINSEESRDQMTVSLQEDLGSVDTNNVNTTTESNYKELDISKEVIISELGQGKEDFSQVKLCTENSISNNRTSHESKKYTQPLQCLIDKTSADDIKECHVSRKYNLPLANIKTDETFVDSEDHAATLLRHLKEIDLTLETDSDLSFTGQFDSPTKSTYHIDVSCVVHVEDCDSEASRGSSLILSSGHEISISAEWKTDSEEPSVTDNAIVKNIVSPFGADDLNQAFNAGTTNDQKDDDINSHLNITYVLDESNESPESTSHKNDACDDLEDDMNASSEAYSDNMERLGSSDEHLGDDSGDSPSDSDILLHTSSIIKDPMELKRLTSELPVKQKPVKEDRSVYSLQDSSLVVPTLSSDSFSTYCSHQSHLVDELELAAFLSDEGCHLDCTDIAEDDRLVSDSSVRNEQDCTELNAENDGIVNKSSNSKDAEPEEEKLEEGFLIHSEGLDSTESLTQWTDQVSPHGSRLCYYHLYFDQTGAEVDTSNENSILDVHVSETSGLGVEKLSQDGLCQMEILHHVSEPLDPNVLDTRDSKVEDENAMIDSSKLQSENLCDFKINLAPCSLVSHSLRDQTSESSSQSGLIGQSDLCQLDDLFAVSSFSDPDMTVTEELHHEGPDTCNLSFSFSNPMFCHCQGGEKKRYSSFISLSSYPCLRKSKSDYSIDFKSLCQNWILQNNSFHDTQHLMFPEDKRTGRRNTVSDVSDFRRSENKCPEYQYEEMTSFSADWSSNFLLIGEDKSGDKVEDLNQCVLFEEDSKEMVTQESGTTEDISCSCHPVSFKFSLADLVQHLMARDQLKNFGFCDDDLTKLLREIMQEARNLTDAERCSVFLLDKDTDELVAMVFDGITADDKEVQGEIRLPKTQGIAGHVATTGTLLNIRDAYSHPLFYRGIDDSTGFRTRNILCFPIKDEEGMVLGVAQLCNKKTFQYFTTFDEDIASAFAVYCCISISHSLMYKKVIDIQYRNSLANELMMFHMKSLMYKKLVDIQHRHRLANELMIFHINQQVPMEEVQLMAENPILPVTTFSINFDSFDFAPRTIPESQTVMSCISMFEDLGFLSRWRIKIDTLVRFLLMVKKGYRNPPYHNWMHAYAVTHFCYLLIKNLHLHNYLDDIELLALFVSCLCHDIDHRGTTNSFQVQSQSVLAALYSSEGSVMERHHLAQSMCILNTDGSNLFENLSSKEYQTVLDLMREIILATDLAHHLRTVKEQEQLAESDSYDRNNAKHKHILLCLLMTACDLSDQTKNWNNTKHIAALVYQEFFSQGDLEKALGKNPMEMMDRERACIPELQISFLDNIAAPVYKILARMFTEAQIPARNVEENRKHWVHIRQLLKLRHGNSTQAMSVEQIISIEEEVDEIPGQGDIHLNGR